MELWDLYDREGNKTEGIWERKNGKNNAYLYKSIRRINHIKFAEVNLSLLFA